MCSHYLRSLSASLILLTVLTANFPLPPTQWNPSKFIKVTSLFHITNTKTQNPKSAQMLDFSALAAHTKHSTSHHVILFPS
jgi:hypothetical protein